VEVVVLQATTLKKIAGAILVMTLLTAVGAVGLALAIEGSSVYEPDRGLGTVALDLAVVVIFASVGGVVALNRPHNLVGWAMLLSGSGMLAGGMLSGYAEYTLLAAPETDAPLALEAGSLGAGSWTFLMAGIFLLIVLFPSGRPASPRWALIAKVVVVGFAIVWLGLSTAPADYDPPLEVFGRNRLSFYSQEWLLVPVFATIAICLFAIIAAGIHLFIRFLKSRGLEREQFKWLAFSACLLAFSIPFSGTARFGILSVIANVTFTVGLLTLPISVGIAVMRYRLYDIDRIINRTLVYAVLTVSLGALYFGVVVGLQTLLRPLSGGNDLAIVATTLMVAALFLPARRQVQALVDRRFNRRAYDAALTVDAFSARLRDQIDLDTLRYELLAVVDETMQPNRASLWLRRAE
jgi:hypothetical protein